MNAISPDISADQRRLIRARVDAQATLEAITEGAAVRRSGIKVDEYRLETMDREIDMAFRNLAAELGYSVEQVRS